VPEEFPSLKNKYTSKLNYESKVAGTCIHCHQVREAERLIFRTANEPIPDKLLFPWPMPDVIGLSLNRLKKPRFRKSHRIPPLPKVAFVPEMNPFSGRPADAFHRRRAMGAAQRWQSGHAESPGPTRNRASIADA